MGARHNDVTAPAHHFNFCFAALKARITLGVAKVVAMDLKQLVDNRIDRLCKLDYGCRRRNIDGDLDFVGAREVILSAYVAPHICVNRIGAGVSELLLEICRVESHCPP